MTSAGQLLIWRALAPGHPVPLFFQLPLGLDEAVRRLDKRDGSLIVELLSGRRGKRDRMSGLPGGGGAAGRAKLLTEKLLVLLKSGVPKGRELKSRLARKALEILGV